MIYEVKKHGVTLEWTESKKEAIARFHEAKPGECVLYEIREDSKTPIAVK